MVTSTWGAEKPQREETCFIERSNFGLRAFAAGPPSTPNSLNLWNASQKKIKNKLYVCTKLWKRNERIMYNISANIS